MTLPTKPRNKTMSTNIQDQAKNSNVSAVEAYGAYVAAFDRRLRGCCVADKATKVKGLRALVRYIDGMVEVGRGADCSVVMSWDGGEPSRVADAAQRRAKALTEIARLEANACDGEFLFSRLRFYDAHCLFLWFRRRLHCLRPLHLTAPPPTNPLNSHHTPTTLSTTSNLQPIFFYPTHPISRAASVASKPGERSEPAPSSARGYPSFCQLTSACQHFSYHLRSRLSDYVAKLFPMEH